MRGYDSESSGFSLVEVVIAMFLLGVIAVALLPALWQGIMLASQQSSTATATRYMHSIVDDARENASCSYLGSIAALPAVSDGRGVSMSTAGTTVSGCASGFTATLELKIEGDGRTLASTTALIYIP
ncbi:type IV pilus modification PilV family protein [Microbacterium cremeum]|uniref:type IV pilus modification PilV family protein n=1 Tax=Microbacterium cremeum TaxID=2782169 RepID=UPI00188862A0|nr:prepilin-type N-terminal cleavage/methylation domain-containing protein [Microbacterium cremeum]